MSVLQKSCSGKTESQLSPQSTKYECICLGLGEKFVAIILVIINVQNLAYCHLLQ